MDAENNVTILSSQGVMCDKNFLLVPREYFTKHNGVHSM